MATFLRPSADTFNGDSWENQLGSTSNLYQSINEVSPDPANFIDSPAAPSNLVYVTKLDAGTDPGVDDGMILFTYLRKDVGGLAQIDMTAELRQGYVDEGTQGTLICTITATNVSSTSTLFQHDLTNGEGASITDFTDLYIRFVANQV